MKGPAALNPAGPFSMCYAPHLPYLTISLQVKSVVLFMQQRAVVQPEWQPVLAQALKSTYTGCPAFQTALLQRCRIGSQQRGKCG